MSDSSTEATGVPGVSSDYVAEISFDDLALSEPLRRGIAERGYTRPTPVQARAIPRVLAGVDLIVRSKTGTGKTAAFGIPMLEKLEPHAGHPQALVLCPTRELALQVAGEITALGAHAGPKVAAIYGGAPMKGQTDALAAGAEIIVGTPGRVYDHIRRGTLDLSRARMAVLDEADEMLNQGFYEEVTRILEHLPERAQMLLFSATVPPDIDRLIRRFCHEPETLLVSGDDLTVEGIEHVLYYTVDAYPKPRNLIYLLELEEPESAIVFCNTRDDTALVNAVLNRNGFDAEVLNGDLPQRERERVMARVKGGELQYLVATDIAARGIDISDLSHVINYTLPEDPAVYLHRVGRTGRIGKKGVALSLVGGREMVTLTALEKRFGIQFEERKLPTPEVARARWAERHLSVLRDASRSAVYDAMLPLAQDLKGLPDGEQLTAFLLRYFFTHRRVEKAAELAQQSEKPAGERRESAERPGRARSGRRRKEERRERRGEHAAPPDSQEATASAEALQAASAGTRLWCNLGTGEGLDEAAIAEALAAASGVSRDRIRAVKARQTHSYVFVEPEAADALIAASGREREGKPIRIEAPRDRR